MIDEGLVQALYGDAARGGDWSPALEKLKALTGAAEAALTIIDRADGLDRVETTGAILTTDLCAAYDDRFLTQDPKNAFFGRAQAGFLFNDVAHFDEGFVRRNPFYQEFTRPMGMRHTLDMLAETGARRQVFLAVMRSARQGPFETEAETTLRRASVHFLEALALEHRFACLNDAKQRSQAALDRLVMGVVALDRRGRVRLANAAARALLEAGNPFRVRQGRLEAATGEAQGALERAIREALAGKTGRARTLRIARADHRHWIVTVTPEEMDAGGAVVMIGDPDAASHSAATQLVDAYGLTVAEAQLALAISEGRTLAAIAAEREVKISTVRSQMLALFDKLGVHRQAEVVRLIASLPPASCFGGETAAG